MIIFIQKTKNKTYNKSILEKDFIITLSSGTTSIPKPIVYDQKTKYLRFKQMKNF